MNLPPTFLLPPALGFVAGLIGASIAWRGRRAGSHPTCRRCGYDLRGKPAESSVCPECGAKLSERKAVRTGRRVARRGWLAASLLLLLLSGASLAGLGLGAAKRVDWNRHKPQWWLVREARGADAPARDAALDELARRIDIRRMSDAQLATLTDQALAYQADVSKPWVKGWGDVVEAAHNTGRLSDDKWRRYARQAVVPSMTLWVRPIERRGKPILLMIRVQPLRAAAAMFFVRWVNQDPSTYSGQAPGQQRHTGGGLWRLTPDRFCLAQARELNIARPLIDGPQIVRVPINVVAYDTSFAGGTPLVNEDLVLTANWTLVPKDAPPVRMRTDAALVAAVRASINVASLNASENGTVLLIELAVNKPPIPLALSGVVRSAGKEWQSQSGVFVDAGGTSTVTLRFRSGLLPDPQTFDVVLKPDLELADKRWDLEEIWGGEIVFRAVKVIR